MIQKNHLLVFEGSKGGLKLIKVCFCWAGSSFDFIRSETVTFSRQYLHPIPAEDGWLGFDIFNV